MTDSPGGSLLGCLGEIVQAHESLALEHINVIPVLYRGLDGDRSNAPFTSALGVMGAVAHFLGGVLVDTSASEYDAPIVTDRDPLLEGALPAVLAGMLGPATELTLEYSSGSIDVHLRRRGRSVTASGGEARFLAVVRALFSPRLRTTNFAVIAYREADLDVRLSPACFRMLCSLNEQPGALSHLRSLVIAVETPYENPGIHCPPGVGARYLLKEQRIIRRHPPERLRSEVARLVQQPERPLVLFLGAGFSFSSSLPVGNGLRDEAIARILGEDPTSDLDWARELFRRQQGLLTPSERQDIDRFARNLTFEQVMRIEKERSGTAVPQGLEDFKTIHDHAVTLPPGPAVRQLQRMLAIPKRLVILTVNFDELVELGHEDQLDVIVEDDQFVALAASGLCDYLDLTTVGRKVPYVKLHGTISDLSTCVASSRQTQQGLAPAKQAALEALLGVDEPLRWVYIGASMRDVDLRPVLDSGAFRRGVDERWVAPFPDPNVEEFATGREQLDNWQTVNMFERSITETADIFMAELARQWLI